jgi:hypothetical protein
MARDSKPKTIKTDEHEEMTVVILRFKGGGETLRKGFATVSDALAALGPPTQNRKLLRADGSPESQSHEIVDPPDSDDDAADGNEDVEPDFRQSTVREYSTPEFLADFQLSPLGKTPWKEYATAKNPQNLNDKYLASAVWLTEHADLETFTRNHVFTCFRAMGWDELRDFTQPMRSMKSKNSYFTNPKRREWKLTTLGSDEAKNLPRSE